LKFTKALEERDKEELEEKKQPTVYARTEEERKKQKTTEHSRLPTSNCMERQSKKERNVKVRDGENRGRDEERERNNPFECKP
jgi:hypothetical protein